MKNAIAKLISWIMSFSLSLRYSISYKNISELKKLKKSKKGCLILPNHPAEIDPILMTTKLWPKFKPHPLVVEKFFYYPGAKFFMDAVGAIPIPDFETSVNAWKVKKGDDAYGQILSKLKEGKNLLVYPSGFLKRTAHEKIGGSSLINRLLTDYQDFNIVLVRMDGLWGSMFSRALTGSIPSFWGLLLKGIKIVFKNFIFFTPRRKISIEFSINPENFPYGADKKEMNRYLEDFYNKYENDKGEIVDEEPLKLVSYRFYRHKVPDIEFDPKRQSLFISKVEAPSSVQEKINAQIRKVLEDEKLQIKPNDQLSFDLGMDSLDVANVYAFLTKEFDLHVKVEPGDLRLVSDLYSLAMKVKDKEANPFKEQLEKKKLEKKEEEKRPIPAIVDERNIPISFLKSCDRMKSLTACGDAISGELSYDRLKLAAIILSKKIAKMKGKYIGIMLPSSCGVYIIILATMLARKIPVMLNWTAGLRSLEHAVDLLDIKTVMSSRKFLDKLDHIEMGKLEDLLILMEDVKSSISTLEKVSGALLAKKKAKAIIRKLELEKIKRDDPAVVLFTSGTEAYPKAVPLSHKNIISNQSAALMCIAMRSNDLMYCCLPPFHSFGFSVVGLLPLLCGMKVFYSPDPTDANQIVSDCEDNGVTILACAPSFLKNVVRVTKEDELRSVRLFVSGAEKAPEDLPSSLTQLGNKNECLFIEGYGITECSPVVTIQRPGTGAKGVGQPLPGITLRVINPDTEQLIDESKPGEICIRGPSVFQGYLGKGKANTFIELEGEQYYRSSDIGYIDEMGSLILSGRLKRFVKIGGEMISLASVEHELICKSLERHLDLDPNEACFVLSAVEKDGVKPRLGLLTTVKMDREVVNEMLKDSGFGRIVKVAKVDVVDKIPTMGTGKIDYRAIDSRFQHELA
ncbi:MAG: AMP-binding protein [Rhabdochlamydiaceae bacterium]|nr:AMP-binding protein [Candidatus Amphrikana amoebophyrae]